MRPWASQMKKGLIELCVIAALRGGEAYGYQILQTLNQRHGLEVTESTIYPILARLAAEGLVSARTTDSSSGPPRRYYRLTSQGRARLQDMTRQWNDFRDTVNALLNGEVP